MVSVKAAAFPLRCAVVADDPALRRFLKENLETRCKSQVLGEATTGADMVRLALTQEPDILVFDVRLRDGSGLEALRQVYQERPVAAVAVVEDCDQDVVRRVMGDYHLAYLLKPVEPHQL